MTSAFSAYNIKLQTAYDATSLKALMTCPRYYQYTILEGWRSSGVHLEFGSFYASAVEHYKKARLEGKTYEQSLLDSLRWLLEYTWMETNPDSVNNGTSNDARPISLYPWGGRYEEQWHCCGTEPYRNSKGNRAKCPWAHSGNWFPTPSPSTCGECGSSTEIIRRWVPESPSKNRVSLVRTFLWYVFDQPETLNDGGLQPFAFPDGTPAVELSFALPSPWVNSYGEPIVLAGHMDALGSFGSEVFITDNKTTGKPLNQAFWQSFSPSVQVDLYDLVGSILYPNLNIRGVIIEGAQVSAASGSRFGLGIIRKSEVQREEFLGELEWWIKQAEIYAKYDYWPMNRSACFLCPFKKICSANPNERQMMLEANFTKKMWNPLTPR